ncbi:MAG: hypothetical protein Q8N78_09245 [Sulfurimonas sp.]|nr:hypothetical protein [Sulfurimonas sp.]
MDEVETSLPMGVDLEVKIYLRLRQDEVKTSFPMGVDLEVKIYLRLRQDEVETSFPREREFGSEDLSSPEVGRG